ncbi:MAG TPA: HAD-IIB family hydrolase [Candidatus Saccharimonadales bacterium]|nr:HAD-IIB family hydrolase [Candidatus Saccharimonadales bacterium]
MATKKLIAFDLDGTLALSKSALADRMSELLNQLLEKYQVCVISGGKFAQFEKQILANLHVSPAKLERLHLMPTCGTRYYAYDVAAANWKQIYAEDFTESQKKAIIGALTDTVQELGFDKEKTWGEQMEDRGSQITFSALGQEAPVDAKEAWDPNTEKKNKIRDLVATRIPEFEVRVGGTTSIDVTKLGIDKAYGMNKLKELIGLTNEEILFLGDKLQEGGNDYPVKAMGIDSLEVDKWQDTARVLEGILYVS